MAFPTDTVYGLGADFLNGRAVHKIYEAKHRPPDLPLPILLAGMEQAASLVDSTPEFARLLMRRFWPGGLTVVLAKSELVPCSITAGSNKVAVRVPNHAAPLAIIRGLGRPIVGTSANLSGRPSPLTAREVRLQLGSEVDLIIDMGRCPGGQESTVVDASGDAPVVLRRGLIPEAEIMKAYDDFVGSEGGSARAHSRGSG